MPSTWAFLFRGKLLSCFNVCIYTQKDKRMNQCVFRTYSASSINTRREGRLEKENSFYSVCGNLNLPFLQIKTRNPSLKTLMYRNSWNFTRQWLHSTKPHQFYIRGLCPSAFWDTVKMQEWKHIPAEGWRLEAFAERVLLNGSMFSLLNCSASLEKPNKQS